jgi:ATPase family associated with various cellular activities (AAA)
MLERVLVALLTGGHVLLEGVPGLPKRLTVSTLATVLGATFGRIQFTPNLVPADVVGTRIWQPGDGTLRAELGPVFAKLLLADENRRRAGEGPVCSGVMQEHQLTIGATRIRVPEHFLDLATPNPIESQGTHDLPEAQVDRFLFTLVVDYPAVDDEIAALASLQDGRLRERPIELVDLKRKPVADALPSVTSVSVRRRPCPGPGARDRRQAPTRGEREHGAGLVAARPGSACGAKSLGTSIGAGEPARRRSPLRARRGPCSMAAGAGHASCIGRHPDVEQLTGRKVIGFMRDNHIDPDLAIELFVLEPRRSGGEDSSS